MSAVTALAKLLAVRGEHSQAEAILKEAEQNSAALCGRRHPDSLRVALLLSQVIAAQGRLDEAHTRMQWEMGAVEQAFGSPSHEAVVAISNLAQILTEQGKLAEAIPLLSGLFGMQHPRTQRLVREVAKAKTFAQASEAAGRMQRRAATMQQRRALRTGGGRRQ